MEDILVPLIAIGIPGAVVALLIWLVFKGRANVQETIRAALEKGDLTPEMIDRLGHPKPHKNKDLRLAFIWLAIGSGIALMGVLVPDPSGHALGGLLATAAIPFMIGVAYLFIWKFASGD